MKPLRKTMILLKKKEECGTTCFTDVKIYYKVITKRHCGLCRKNGQIDEGTKWRAQKKKKAQEIKIC